MKKKVLILTTCFIVTITTITGGSFSKAEGNTTKNI